jgi:hypothetical protein
VVGLALAGAAVVGSIGLAAVYDYVARRRGRNTSVSLSGPINGAGVRGDSPSHVDLP